MNWVAKACQQDRVEVLANEFNLSQVAATLVSRVAVGDDLKNFKKFLYPKITHLESPLLIPNLEAAVRLLAEAIAHRQRLFVIGDYDVDGVTGTALFVSIMRRLGVRTEFAIPRRCEDGVGLSAGMLNTHIFENGESYDMVVALDCGTNDSEMVGNLLNNGLQVLVVDHHKIRESLPEQAILVNPHLDAANCGCATNLCSVALVYKLVQGLLMHLRAAGNETAVAISIKDYLDLVALGTLTDLVPLTGDNRILVKHGLHRIGKSKNVGLQALMDVCSLPYGRDLDVADVSYKIGPRLNAGGRMADARTSVNLLLEPRFSECVKYAHELDGLNQDRQSTERLIFEQASSYLSRRSHKSAIVLYDPDWHTGVVGIVSSRLARQFQVPVVVLGSDGLCARGSVRSVENLDVMKVLEQCDALIDSWGGHPMAAGLSIRPENIEAFREAFTEGVLKQWKHGGNVQKEQDEHFEVDAWLQCKDIRYEFLQELAMMGPFGIANPEPVLALKGAQLASKVARFGTDNFKFWVNLLDTDYDMMCLGWGFPSRIPESRHALDLLFHLKWHEWKGRGYPQATILDWRYST